MKLNKLALLDRVSRNSSTYLHNREIDYAIKPYERIPAHSKTEATGSEVNK